MKKRNSSQGDHGSIKSLMREKVGGVYLYSSIKKITSALLMIFGVILLINGYLNDTVHFINLGIGLVVVGWILLIFTYDRCIEYSTISSILSDYIDLIKRLINGLDIKTSGVVIPPRENLKDGCIYLPFHENFKVNLSIMDDNALFVNSDNRDEIGLLLPPVGRRLKKLLKKYRGDHETSFEDGDINHLLEYLEYLLNFLQVGGGVKVEITGDTVLISYRVEDNSLCRKLQRDDICRKYPCPVCGAILLTASEFLDEVLKIESIKEENKRVSIKLRVIRDVLK